MEPRWITPLALLALGVGASMASGQTVTEPALLSRLRELENRVAVLEGRLAACAPAASPKPANAAPEAPVAPETPAVAGPAPAGDWPSLPGFASGTTLNVLLDGYYEYNFNRPAGRVNLLRSFDPTSNGFTVNQGAIVVERAADPANGRRLGVRLDLMFGQAAESLSGNAANEPRTAPYRNIYQAYGTYVLPVGKGLNVDFGRFSSPLGMESSFAKDQINYTRSLLFAALPFYHTGFRAAYKIDDSTTATWMLVNGANQTEDFNGFKSTHFMLSKSFGKNLTWTGGYYAGREGHDGDQRVDGRTHIADTYLTWNATSKLTVAGEADYVIGRTQADSAPLRLTGGAAYARYQLFPAFYVAGRYEYVSDRGGLLSGQVQALKEGTITASYQPVKGFQIRWEFRRDYSNRPFFPAHGTGILKRDQNTALLGFLWWFGGKQGSW